MIDTAITVLIVTLVIGILSLVISYASFALGKLVQAQKDFSQLSTFSLLASIWTLQEASGLKKSTIIQRVIEKYHPTTAVSPEAERQLKAETDELFGALSNGDVPPTKEQFAMRGQLPPEDLV